MPLKNGWEWIWSIREISPRTSLLIKSPAADERELEKKVYNNVTECFFIAKSEEKILKTYLVM